MGPSAEEIALCRRLDELYTAHPFYGVHRMTEVLRRQGATVNSKRVRRLLRQMGLLAAYPKLRLSQPALGQSVLPYLLRGLSIERPHQVWAVDLTYVRLRGGFAYLVALLEWFSRYVLAWELSAEPGDAALLARPGGGVGPSGLRGADHRQRSGHSIHQRRMDWCCANGGHGGPS